MIEIPLNNSPEQLFSVTLDGKTYDCRVTFNSRWETWTIGIATQGTVLLSGIALLGGVDIFRSYNVPIENVFVVNLNNPNEDPTSDDLGTVSRLYILTDSEVTADG